MNVRTAGGHLVFFGKIILRGPSRKPKEASDPKIPPKPLVDIHLKIQSLIYIVPQANSGEKTRFPEGGPCRPPP